MTIDKQFHGDREAI